MKETSVAEAVFPPQALSCCGLVELPLKVTYQSCLFWRKWLKSQCLAGKLWWWLSKRCYLNYRLMPVNRVPVNGPLESVSINRSRKPLASKLAPGTVVIKWTNPAPRVQNSVWSILEASVSLVISIGQFYLKGLYPGAREMVLADQTWGLEFRSPAPIIMLACDLWAGDRAKIRVTLDTRGSLSQPVWLKQPAPSSMERGTLSGGGKCREK